MKNMDQKFDELNTELTRQTTEFLAEMKKGICKLQCRYPTHHTIPQVRHHRQHGRIDVGFLCSCSAAEPIVLFLVLPLRQIREILTHDTNTSSSWLWL
jgi:hypothetical protein